MLFRHYPSENPYSYTQMFLQRSYVKRITVGNIANIISDIHHIVISSREDNIITSHKPGVDTAISSFFIIPSFTQTHCVVCGFCIIHYIPIILRVPNQYNSGHYKY